MPVDRRNQSRRKLSACAAFVLALGMALLLDMPVASADPSELPPEIGYNYGEIETPRIAAMGGAQRAFSNSLSGLFINPANMAATRVYHVGALAQIWPEASRQSYAAGAVDSVVSSARIAGGLAYAYNIQDPDGVDRTSSDLRFALALPFSDKFFAGIGGRYLWLNQNGLGPLGASRPSAGLRDQNIVEGLALDAGLTVKPTEILAIALVGNNLNNPGSGFQPTSVSGGVGVGTENFTIEADLAVDFTTWQDTTLRPMAGGEFLIADHFPVRAGYRYDQGANSHAISGGFGYMDTTFSTDIALRRVISGDAVTAIVLGLTLHLEGLGMTPAPTDTF